MALVSRAETLSIPLSQEPDTKSARHNEWCVVRDMTQTDYNDIISVLCFRSQLRVIVPGLSNKIGDPLEHLKAIETRDSEQPLLSNHSRP